MRPQAMLFRVPQTVWKLATAYFLASLAHFAHNAEYIAIYPNMPGWLTREHVYLAWLAVTAVGAAALQLLRMSLFAAGAALLGAWGGLGLDGLAHYTLALCSEHTLATNITIWAEATLGMLLLFASAVLLGWRLRGARTDRRPDF